MIARANGTGNRLYSGSCTLDTSNNHELQAVSPQIMVPYQGKAVNPKPIHKLTSPPRAVTEASPFATLESIAPAFYLKTVWS